MSATDLELVEFQRTMAHIPYISGYSPLRCWQQGIDVELKKNGCHKTSRDTAIRIRSEQQEMK
jgi:hypothetical protein